MELLKLIHVQFHLDSYYITVLETVIQNLLSELISNVLNGMYEAPLCSIYKNIFEV